MPLVYLQQLQYRKLNQYLVSRIGISVADLKQIVDDTFCNIIAVLALFLDLFHMHAWNDQDFPCIWIRYLANIAAYRPIIKQCFDGLHRAGFYSGFQGSFVQHFIIYAEISLHIVQQKGLQSLKPVQHLLGLVDGVSFLNIRRQIFRVRQNALCTHLLDGVNDFCFFNSEQIRQIIHSGFCIILLCAGNVFAGDQRADDPSGSFPLCIVLEPG